MRSVKCLTDSFFVSSDIFFGHFVDLICHFLDGEEDLQKSGQQVNNKEIRTSADWKV